MNSYRTLACIFLLLVLFENQQCSIAELSEFALPERFKRNESIITKFNRMLREYQPLDLGEGFPNYYPSKAVKKALADTAISNDYSLGQYAPNDGHPRLLKALSNMYSKLLNRTLNPNDNIVVTVGATEALFVTFLTHTFPEDEWIVFEPFYEYYVPMIKAALGIPKFIRLKPKVMTPNITSADWTFDKEELANLFNEKTKGILVNTPHNPSGKVFTLDELTYIADLAKKWKTLVVFDEVYQFLTFDNNKHIRISTLPGMFERTITVGSAGKLFGVTGYRVGWAYGDAKLINNLKVAHEVAVLTMTTPTQYAVAVALEQEIEVLGEPHSFLETMNKQTEAKRNYLHKILRDFGMDPVLPGGTYFMTVNWTSIGKSIKLDPEEEGCDDYKFAKWLLTNVKILALPLSTFYGNANECSGKDLIRFTNIKMYKTYQDAEKLFSKWKSQH